MFCNQDFRQEMPMGAENFIDIDINNTNMNTAMATSQAPMMGGYGSPIVETPQQRVVHRSFVHEVPHVCPMNTKIVNHHIYRHTYQPRYSCCEENVVSNEQCGSCCQFR